MASDDTHYVVNSYDNILIALRSDLVHCCMFYLNELSLVNR